MKWVYAFLRLNGLFFMVLSMLNEYHDHDLQMATNNIAWAAACLALAILAKPEAHNA